MADVSESPLSSTPSGRSARALFVFARAIVAFASFFVTVNGVEAEKETRLLCGVSKPGTSATEVDRRLGTAKLLRIHSETGATRVSAALPPGHGVQRHGCAAECLATAPSKAPRA